MNEKKPGTGDAVRKGIITFLKRLAALFFMILGIVFGFAFSLLIIARLLHISLDPATHKAAAVHERPSHYYSRIMARIHSRHPSRPSSLPDLETIDDVNRLKEMASKSLENKEFYDTEEILNRIRTLQPDFPDYYWYLGLSKEGQEDPREALKAYEEYQKTTGCDPGRLLYIANFMIMQKDFKRALAVLSTAKKIETTPEVYYLIARCHYLKADYRKAVENLKFALKLNSACPDVHELLAECHIKNGNTGEAVNSYINACNAEPRTAYMLRIAVLSNEIGDYGTAKKYLNRYIDAEGDAEKAGRAREFLARVKINAMKNIPPEVERQRDSLPEVKMMGVFRGGGTCKALLAVRGDSEEVQEGDTVLKDYYVLSINESRIVLIRDEAYTVLRAQ